LKHAPDSTSYQRANAAFVMKDYGEAERLALEAADQELKAPLPETQTWTAKGTGPPPCLPNQFVDPQTGDTWRYDYTNGRWLSYSVTGQSTVMGPGPPFPCEGPPTAKNQSDGEPQS
jgi:hypothetical protein